MFEFPRDFVWLPPWVLLPNDYHTLIPISFPDEYIAAMGPDAIVAELHREMPEGHRLYGLAMKAIAVHVEAGQKDYVFATNDVSKPIACVHLTFSVESDPRWPMTNVFPNLPAWCAAMKTDYDRAGCPPLECDGNHYQMIGRQIAGEEVYCCARCGAEMWRPPAKQHNEQPCHEPGNGLQAFTAGKSTVRSRLRQPLLGRDQSDLRDRACYWGLTWPKTGKRWLG